jgi:hypothetical protein
MAREDLLFSTAMLGAQSSFFNLWFSVAPTAADDRCGGSARLSCNICTVRKS